MKYLYKYPQRAFPYSELVEVNRTRGKLAPEFELIDTGVFDDDRYFDVVIEYAKADVEDVLIKITAKNCFRQSGFETHGPGITTSRGQSFNVPVRRLN
jgi:hypothetical protein